MAGVYIKGMEMPKDGVHRCEIGIAGDIAVLTIYGGIEEERKSFHLVSARDHGDLIDRSLLEEDGEWDEREDAYVWYSRAHIYDAPAVICADKEEA